MSLKRRLKALTIPRRLQHYLIIWKLEGRVYLRLAIRPFTRASYAAAVAKNADELNGEEVEATVQ